MESSGESKQQQHIAGASGSTGEAASDPRTQQLAPLKVKQNNERSKKRHRRRRRERTSSSSSRRTTGTHGPSPYVGSQPRTPQLTPEAAAKMPELPPEVKVKLGAAARRKARALRKRWGRPLGSPNDSTPVPPSAQSAPKTVPRKSSKLGAAFSFVKRKFSSQRIEPLLGTGTNPGELLRKKRAVTLAISGATSLWEGQQFRAKVLGASNAAVQQKEKPTIEKTMIHPLSLFTSVWEGMFLVFLLYVTVRVPFFISFTRTSEWYTQVADFVTTIFFIADIGVNFRTCYVDDGELIFDPWTVAKHYMHGWFLYDVAASIPYTWFFPSSPQVRLFLMLRLVRLVKMEKVLDRIARKWDIGEIMQLWLRVFTLGFYITVCGHVSGCAWFYIASKIDEHDDSSWTVLSGIDTEESLKVQYLTSLYWAFTTLTTVGYGDISAHTQWEKGFSVIMLMAGAAVFAMLVGKMSALSTERNARIIELRKRQSMLDEFLRQTNLPKELRSRVRDYSEFLTRKHKYLSEKVLLDDLSPALRRAVNRHVNRDILDSVPVFKFGSAAFRTTMAQELQPVLGVKGEFIITAEDVVREMYFVKSGTVQLVSRTGFVLLTLREGSFFGELSVLDGKAAKHSVYAATDCELFMLTAESLTTILSDFPDFESTIRKLAALRDSNCVVPKPEDTQLPPPSGFDAWSEVTQSSNFQRFYNEQMRQSRSHKAKSYKPRPRLVRNVTLSKQVASMLPIIANHAHDQWAHDKIENGWTFGPRRNDVHKTHPRLVSFSDLPQQQQESGTMLAEYALKYLHLLNYTAVKAVVVDEEGNRAEEVAPFRWSFGRASMEPDGTYEPRPFPVMSVELPSDMADTVEIVAKEVHERWAKAKVDAGWKWGPRNNDKFRKDSALLPWQYLTELQREQNRASVEAALKLLVGYGFQFLHGRRTLVGRTKFVTVRRPSQHPSSLSSRPPLAQTLHTHLLGSGAGTPVSSLGASDEMDSPSNVHVGLQASTRLRSASAAGTTVSAGDIAVVVQRIEQLESVVSTLVDRVGVMLRREYVLKPYVSGETGRHSSARRSRRRHRRSTSKERGASAEATATDDAS